MSSYADEEVEFDPTTGEATTGGEYTQKVRDTPDQVTTNEMGAYPKETEDNWHRFSNSQRDSAYEQHLDKFGDKFSEYWWNKNKLRINPNGGTYNAAKRTITYPDGTEIYLDTMDNREIEPVAGAVIIDSIRYTNAKNVRGNPDNSTSTDSANIIASDSIYFISPKNASFISTPTSVTIKTTEDLSIIDAGGAEVRIKPIGEGSVTVSKTIPITYNLSSVELKYKHETFTANNTASLTLDKTLGIGLL